MSKQKGVLRYTDKATGRPVMDVPSEMIAAWTGKPQPSRTARRAVSRWTQGAMNQGKGDMPRPQTPEGKDAANASWLRAFCRRDTHDDQTCRCFECQQKEDVNNGR